MVSYRLAPEQQDLRDSVAQFAREVVAPVIGGYYGRGYAQFLRILDEGRVVIAALATGLAQGCVDECVRYAGQREAFGRRLEQHQAIQFTVADMEARVHAARLAWYDAAARLMAGQPVKKESAIARSSPPRTRRWTTPGPPPRCSVATAS